MLLSSSLSRVDMTTGRMECFKVFPESEAYSEYGIRLMLTPRSAKARYSTKPATVHGAAEAAEIYYQHPFDARENFQELPLIRHLGQGHINEGH
ncbi:hypothetical protein Tco_0487549 [Tanacetum coccineum]